MNFYFIILNRNFDSRMNKILKGISMKTKQINQDVLKIQTDFSEAELKKLPFVKDVKQTVDFD